MDAFTLHNEAHDSSNESGIPESLRKHRERIERLWEAVDKPVFRKLVRLRVMHAAVTEGRVAAATVSKAVAVVHRRDRSRWLMDDPDEWLKRLEEAWLGPEKRAPKYRKLSDHDWRVVAEVVRNNRRATWAETAGLVRKEANREGSPIPHLKKISASTLCRGSELLGRILGESAKPPELRRRRGSVGKRRVTGRNRKPSRPSEGDGNSLGL